MGLPSLEGPNKDKVVRDNLAAEFVLAELKLHQAAGGASGRENPWNSLHWFTPTEEAMKTQATWFDTIFDACVFHGARQKRTRLRHDVEEIHAWPEATCRHTHDPAEWAPITCAGNTIFPTREESEYTANFVFHIVHAVSYWACRVGRAKMRVPRAPPMDRGGATA